MGGPWPTSPTPFCMLTPDAPAETKFVQSRESTGLSSTSELLSISFPLLETPHCLHSASKSVSSPSALRLIASLPSKPLLGSHSADGTPSATHAPASATEMEPLLGQEMCLSASLFYLQGWKSFLTLGPLLSHRSFFMSNGELLAVYTPRNHTWQPCLAPSAHSSNTMVDPRKHHDYHLESRPFIVQASPARWVF